jgi:transcription initiation factor TFIIB
MESPNHWQTTENSQQPQAEDIDPQEFDPEDIVRTADGEVIHEPTGLILEEEALLKSLKIYMFVV